MGKTIAIVSGKGGVGKSTVAACLATELAEMGSKVLAVDCDFGFRNLDMLLGLENEPVYDIADAVAGEALNRCVVKPSGKKPYFLASCLHGEQQIQEADFVATVRKLAQNCDFLLLDGAAGLGQSFSLCTAAAELCLLVTTPDKTALRDAERVAYMLAAQKKECRLVINRIRPKQVKAGYVLDMDSIIDYVGVQLIGLLPEDKKIALEQNLGKNIMAQRHRPFVRALASTAGKLRGDPAGLYRFW